MAQFAFLFSPRSGCANATTRTRGSIPVKNTNSPVPKPTAKLEGRRKRGGEWTSSTAPTGGDVDPMRLLNMGS